MPQLTLKLVDKTIKIGDRVYCTMFGFGVVIEYRPDKAYPIKAEFSKSDTKVTNSYSLEGSYVPHVEPTLYKIPGGTTSTDVNVVVTLTI